MTTNTVSTGYSQKAWRRRHDVVEISAHAHHNAQPTCKLGIAAKLLTSVFESFPSTVPKMWRTARVSMIPGWAIRGGASAHSQKTSNDATLAATRAERHRA